MLWVKHNRIIICTKCDKISHFNCALKIFSYDHIKDNWTCDECFSTSPVRYNPFASITYDKYSGDDPEVYEEITQAVKLLEDCKVYSFESLTDNAMKQENNSNISICFNNIDGVKSNFDSLAAEFCLLKNKFDIITLAETNIDCTHKDMFQLPGYNSVFQSKMPDKQKGSGLGIYLKTKLQYETLEHVSNCTTNLESFFIKIKNTSEPLIVGVIYRPPSGSLDRAAK